MADDARRVAVCAYSAIGVFHGSPESVAIYFDPVYSKTFTFAWDGGALFRPDAVAKSTVRIYDLPEEVALLRGEKQRSKCDDYGLEPLQVVATGYGQPSLM
jgi:hypothetical protein